MRVRCMPLYCHLIYLFTFFILSFINILTLINCNQHSNTNHRSAPGLPFTALFSSDFSNGIKREKVNVIGTKRRASRYDDIYDIKKEEQLLLEVEEDEEAVNRNLNQNHNARSIGKVQVQHKERPHGKSEERLVKPSPLHTKDEPSQNRRRSQRKEVKGSHSKKKHKRKDRENVDLEFSAADAGVSVSDLSDSILRYLPSDTDEEVSQALKSLAIEEKQEDKGASPSQVNPVSGGKEDLRRTKKLRKKKKKSKYEEGEDDDLGLSLGLGSASGLSPALGHSPGLANPESLEDNVDKIFGSLLEKIDEQLQINEKAVEAEDLYGEAETEAESESESEAEVVAVAVADESTSITIATEAATATKKDLTTIQTNTGETYTARRVNGTLEVKLKPQVRRSKRLFKVVGGQKFVSLFRAWEHAGWTRKHDPFPSAEVELFLTKPITKVPGSRGRMISQIASSSCIGGTKGVQLRCRQTFAEQHNCSFTDLGVSPRQYNILDREECKDFLVDAANKANSDKFWIGKQGGAYHGSHMTIFKGLPPSIKKRVGKCSSDRHVGAGYIMMEYIVKPLLFNNHKFDLRTYLLIASTHPFLVFYHDGFIRRSVAEYSNKTFNKLAHITNYRHQPEDDHFWGFQQLEDYLHSAKGIPRSFMRSSFRKHAKRVTNFVFQASRSRLKRRAGAFMLFALDWVIDEDLDIHLLEGNGNPTVRHYENTGLTPEIWHMMAQLLTLIHEEPHKLDRKLTVTNKFSYGGWDLVFNEAEEDASGKPYNPCHHPSKGGLRRKAKTHSVSSQPR